MTISSTTNRNDFVGNGATSTFSYSYKIFLEAELEVRVEDLLGVVTPLTLTTDYTVTGAGETAGGTIVLVDSGQAWLTSGFLITDYKISIQRTRTLTQATDIRNQGDFFPETHEDEFDKQIMNDQQLDRGIDRSLKLLFTEVPVEAAVTWPSVADRSSNFLAFDASGNPIASSGISSVPVSAFMAGLLDDTTAAAGRTTLGAVGLTGNETIAGEKTFSDNIAFGAGITSLFGRGFRAYLNSVQTIPLNTLTTLIFGVENFDDDSTYDNSTGIFTAPATGTYDFTFQITWNGLNNGTRTVALWKNDTSLNHQQHLMGTFDANALAQNVSGKIALLINDTLRVKVFQDGAANLDIINGLELTNFTVARIK